MTIQAKISGGLGHSAVQGNVQTKWSDDLDYYSRQLDEKGVVNIPDVFTQGQIDEFKVAVDRSFEQVKKIVLVQDRKEMNYISAFDKVYNNKKYYFELPDGSHILELAKGRYDFPIGKEKDVFSTENFLNPEPITTLIRMKLKAQYVSIAGAVPSTPKSEEGPWHRDIYPLFYTGDDKYDDSIELNLMPPIYYTLLIPLEDLTEENGATEFIPGSHRLGFEDSKSLPRFQSMTKAGSALLFDGRIFHRGRANKTDDLRMVLYRVFHKTWYCDY